jgi:uridine phosphorylase
VIAAEPPKPNWKATQAADVALSMVFSVDAFYSGKQRRWPMEETRSVPSAEENLNGVFR